MGAVWFMLHLLSSAQAGAPARNIHLIVGLQLVREVIRLMGPRMFGCRRSLNFIVNNHRPKPAEGSVSAISQVSP